ncbi:hypothetical protein F4813DRAFT_366624 [Daldinia decipiens]|uniref:uncharacterized protein n=1 Tax=Daldinia decipiens TaxID=326647 RepID=UPI0020C30B00|nr:uncharacterized protein F4813DRAFT_366624 [Daldinia decipiens]KAI1655599.1 hypothetical protein F4813DRAFT_366624 [Daldinia decipiens]
MTSRQPSSSTGHSRNADKQGKLLTGYRNIRDILDGAVQNGKFVNVVGLVKDRRSAIQTRGVDWKSVVTIYDKSIEDEPDKGLVINIFRPELSEIPEPDAGDVVLIIYAKVQSRYNEFSLLSHKSTIIHMYSASKIPRPPKSAKQALLDPVRPSDRRPLDKEHEYVSWLYHSTNKSVIPDAAEFTFQVDQSRNVKDKFKVLSDIQEGQFCDVIVNVIKDPFDQMDKATLWVSDYTENDAFYKFSWDSIDISEGRDGDPYGYTMKNVTPNTWPGPYGKRSLQITCFGLHGEFVRDEVKAGAWVKLRNLHIKYGHNANNLEGYLREDRSAFNPGVQIDLLSTDDQNNIDQRLKDAIRRKRDYEKAKKSQMKNFAANESGKGNGGKRKEENQEEKKRASKLRRMEQRAQKSKWGEEPEPEQEAGLDLNELIKCENMDQPIFPVSSIIKPVPWTTTVDGQETTLTLPFTCAKYRANVRVIDFRPRKLEDFATWRKNTEFDMLSDHSGASDSESDEDQSTLDRYRGDKVWEWRFSLLLEEANPKKKGEDNSLWVVVDNTEAQMLINLDAVDLRANPSDLDHLREQMFKLWGNLEECKQQELQNQQKNKQRVAAQQPPDSTPPRPPSSHPAQNAVQGESIVSNKPFTCCIRQYGVKLPESDPRKANAGKGKRWERVFGMFGTKISS